MAKTLEKSFSSSIDSAIAAAAGSLDVKQSFATLEDARTNFETRSIFDASLSQFTKGIVLGFFPDKMKFAITNIGTNGASVVTVPAGTKGADGKITYDRAMNVYLSSFRKEIRVTDANGEPVQEADGSQTIIDGRGNELWEACHAAKSDAGVLDVLLNKEIEITDLKKGYGPANFVEIGGSRVPKGHRLTTLPLGVVL